MSSSTVLPPDFYFIESFYLLICSRHQMAIPPTQINQHLRDHFMSHEINLNQYKKSLATLPIISIHQSHSLIRNAEPIIPLPFLTQPRDGYACGVPHCHHLAMSLYTLKRHLKEKHEKSGSSQQDPLIESVTIQSLIHGQYLFTVLQLEVSSLTLIIYSSSYTNIYI